MAHSAIRWCCGYARPYADFWRGQTFTQFDGRVWRVEAATGERTEGPDHSIEPAVGDVSTGAGDQFIQTFYAEVDLPNIVFAASRAERVLLGAPLWARPDGALRADVVLPAGSAYTVVSQRSDATAAGLRGEGDLSLLGSPAEFIDVPDTTSARTRALAQQLAATRWYDTLHVRHGDRDPGLVARARDVQPRSARTAGRRRRRRLLLVRVPAGFLRTDRDSNGHHAAHARRPRPNRDGLRAERT